MHIWTSWGVLGYPRVSWSIKTDRIISICVEKIKFAYAGGGSEIDYTTHESEHSTNSAYRGKFPS